MNRSMHRTDASGEWFVVDELRMSELKSKSELKLTRRIRRYWFAEKRRTQRANVGNVIHAICDIEPIGSK
jgi:hypothetical protein